MGVIDYGVLVWKNGKRYKRNENSSEYWFCPNIDELGLDPWQNTFKKANTSKIEICFRDWGDCRYKVLHTDYNDAHFDMKEICDKVYLTRIRNGSDHYVVLSGYGIDCNKSSWDSCKAKYLGKKNAAKVDKIINKYGW